MSTQNPITAARQVLKKSDERPPIDVLAIVKAHGISVVFQELEDVVSGMLVAKGQRAVIAVNKNHHIHRQRFTMAHEFGHFLLHRAAGNVFVDGSVFFRDETSAEGTNLQEIEANAFAAELLMPEELLMARVAGRRLDAFDDVVIHQLADEYGVSTQALTIRLTKLGLLAI
jgi:Zn-dependent peptidase ImmA (M78 family)